MMKNNTSLSHAGEHILLKISGTEIEDEEKFDALAQKIKSYVQEGVKFVLAVGGGKIIDKHFLENTGHGREVEKEAGMTTQEVLTKAVLPAYQEVVTKLSAVFSEEDANIIFTQQVSCEYKNFEEKGFVGKPVSIEGIDLEKPINIVAFLGNVDGQYVNVNADDIAEAINKQYGEDIDEVVFVTSTEGLLDNEGNIVSLLTFDELEAVLAGTHDSIQVKDGMKIKLESIKEIMSSGQKKVALVGPNNLGDELDTVLGAGTLIVPKLESFSMHPITEEQYDVFEDIYEFSVVGGVWKERDEAEKEHVKEHHQLFLSEDTDIFLGGFTFSDLGLEEKTHLPQECKKLECFWAQANSLGNPLADALVEQAKSQHALIYLKVQKDNIAAQKFFQKHGFQPFSLPGDEDEDSSKGYFWKKDEGEDEDEDEDGNKQNT